jgi:hypothetical protein
MTSLASHLMGPSAWENLAYFLAHQQKCLKVCWIEFYTLLLWGTCCCCWGLGYCFLGGLVTFVNAPDACSGGGSSFQFKKFVARTPGKRSWTSGHMLYHMSQRWICWLSQVESSPGVYAAISSAYCTYVKTTVTLFHELQMSVLNYLMFSPHINRHV